MNYASAASGIRPETGSQRVLFIYHSFLICLSLSLISFWYNIGRFVFQFSRMPPRRVTLSVWKNRSKITETYITELLRNLGVQIKLKSTLASACIIWEQEPMITTVITSSPRFSQQAATLQLINMLKILSDATLDIWRCFTNFYFFFSFLTNSQAHCS